jgi:aspartyl protease family protein
MFEGLDGMDKANALYLTLLLLIVLVSSASLRRIGFRRALGMAAAWVAIFAAIIIVTTYRDDASTVFNRLAGEVDPARGRVEGQEFLIRARDDGHFWVRATINGEPVLFLVDTGATDVVLTEDAARRVGIDMSRLIFDRVASTANGPVRGAGTRVATFEVGPIVRTNVPVSVTEGALDTNLLGMSFMRTLGGWRVEGDTLVMRP